MFVAERRLGRNAPALRYQDECTEPQGSGGDGTLGSMEPMSLNGAIRLAEKSSKSMNKIIAEEQQQLAEWLKELKMRREENPYNPPTDIPAPFRDIEDKALKCMLLIMFFEMSWLFGVSIGDLISSVAMEYFK